MEGNTKQEELYEGYENEIETMVGSLELGKVTTDHTLKAPPRDRKATQIKALRQRLAIREATIQDLYRQIKLKDTNIEALNKQIKLKDKGIESLKQSFQSAYHKKERKEKENKILKAGVISLIFALAFVSLKRK